MSGSDDESLKAPDYAAMARVLADLASRAAVRARRSGGEGDEARLRRLAEQLSACSADMERELAGHIHQSSDWRLSLLNFEKHSIHADHAHRGAGGQIGPFDGPV